MNRGYDRPLYILPFDHRHTYAEVFGFREPMTPEHAAVISDSKQLVYEAYQRALSQGLKADESGILVDEEFGAAILRDARRRGYIFCMPTEKSGQHEFDFQHGDDFAKAIEEFEPTFTKVLVRYNPAGEAHLNARQLERLKRLNDFLQATDRLFMFELIVPAEPDQLSKLNGDVARYDLELRPELMVQSIREIQTAGIEPDVWKIEGLDRSEDCARVVEVARRDGRNRVGLIVLGRGENEQKVAQWLTTAAAVPGFIGFAVGRSTFLHPITDWRAGRLTREAAIADVASRYLHWAQVFTSAKRG